MVLCGCVACWGDFFFEGVGDHRELHVLTHSFPTRRSSDLLVCGVGGGKKAVGADIGSKRGNRLFGRGLGLLCCRTAGNSAPGCKANDHGQGGNAYAGRSEEHTSELQSLMRISYAVLCLKKKKPTKE